MTNVCILFFSALFTTISAAAGIDSFDQLNSFLTNSPRTDVYTIMSAIDVEMRKNFALVYESRSPHAASLEIPRIVLVSPNGDFLLGISPPNGKKNPGGVIEMIDLSEGSPRLRRINFTNDSFSVEKNTPRSCAGCHSRVKAGEESSFFRPIWDGYPDWPGVFGSSHNGFIMNYRGKYGTSGFLELEFEAQALNRLKANLGQSVYGLLPGLADSSLFGLSERLTEITTQLLRFQDSVVLTQSKRKIELMSQTELARFRERLSDRAKIEADTQRWMTELHRRQRTYYSNKLGRIESLVTRYGTENDREMLDGSKNFKLLPDNDPGLAAFGLRVSDPNFPNTFRNINYRTTEHQRELARYLDTMNYLGLDLDLLGTHLETGSWVTTSEASPASSAAVVNQFIKKFAENPSLTFDCETVLSIP